MACFDLLRGAPPPLQPPRQWDWIVLTAANASQKMIFEKQLVELAARSSGKIGSVVVDSDAKTNFRVVEDPPRIDEGGGSVGCGGSTLAVLMALSLEAKLLGLEAPWKRGQTILIIHAGGFSKRLPNHSATGKVFSPVPLSSYRLIDDTGEQSSSGRVAVFLELKLANYEMFPQAMPHGGVLVTCSDDVQFFDAAKLDFSLPGFTALAHAESIDIGTGHGVFVLNGEGTEARKTVLRKCRRFLHKPTKEVMRELGATFAGIDDSESVFVDSTFFFDGSIAESFVAYTRAAEFAFDCEIDAYGDFLQPLGDEPSNAYFTSTRTTGSDVSPRLAKRRSELFQLLRGTALNVLALPGSEFVHIGTMTEYSRHFSSTFPHKSFPLIQQVAWVNNMGQFSNERGRLVSSSASILSSIVNTAAEVGDGSVIEFCDISCASAVSQALIADDVGLGSAITVGSNCILSHVVLSQESSPIPHRSFLHTVVLDVKALAATSADNRQHLAFCTIALGIDDDIKASLGGTLLGSSVLDVVLPALGLNADVVWPQGSERECPFWEAKLFPIVWASSSQTSDILAAQRRSSAYGVELLQAASNGRLHDGSLWRGTHLLSLADLSAGRSPDLQLRVRAEIVESIASLATAHALLDEKSLPGQFEEPSFMSEIVSALAFLRDPLIAHNRRSQDAFYSSTLRNEVAANIEHSLNRFLKKIQLNLIRCTHDGSMLSVRRARAWHLVFLICRQFQNAKALSHDVQISVEQRALKARECAELELMRVITCPLVQQDPELSVTGALSFGLTPTSLAPVGIGRILGAKLDNDSSCDADFALFGVLIDQARRVSIQLPARIILAGGWSDTPPYCIERPAEIVNFAITINGERPIRAVASVSNNNDHGRNTAPLLQLISRDGGQQQVFDFGSDKDIQSLFDFNKNGEVLALHKAICCLLFFGPACTMKNTDRVRAQYAVWCRAVMIMLTAPFSSKGGRICITLETDVNIPQGSGLGTSSIIMLAGIRALRMVFSKQHDGLSLSSDSLLNLELNAVQAVEQLLTSCGGWQDQVGGSLPGIKHIKTVPNDLLEFEIHSVPLSEPHCQEFNRRLLVIWTGRTRVAKAILKSVMSHWQERRDGVEELMDGIVQNATKLWSVLLSFSRRVLEDREGIEEDFLAIGRIVDASRTANTALEESVTGDYIDSMISCMQPFVSGVNIIGSGGGGFLVGFLKHGASKEATLAAMQATFPQCELADVSLAQS